MKRMAGRLMFCLAVCALGAPTVVSAQTTPFAPFTDDFEDGSVGDDAPVSLVSGGLPATINVANGDMVLTEPFQLEGFSLGLTTVQLDGRDVLSGDVSARAVVRVSDEMVFAGIGMREQTQENGGDGGAYFGNIRGDGLITTGSWTGQRVTLETPLDPVNTDVVLQVDAINDATGGARVITTAWAADNPSAKYSRTFVDTLARPAGFMGQSFGRDLSNDPTGASATFRSFQVLEPSFVPFVPFTDDFEGGDSGVSIVPGGLPSTIEIANGDMVLTKPIQLEGFSLGLTTVQLDGRDVLSGDASARAVVRVSDEMVFAGIGMREQSQENGGDGGAYFGNIRGDGLITTGSFTGQALTLETPLDPVNTDVVLRVDTVNDGTGGALVITTAWAAANPSAKYSQTFTDAVARPPGFMGQSFGRGGDDATGASATFRSFEVVEAVAPPTLRIEPAIVLSWPIGAEGYALMGADSVNGPWMEIDAEVKVDGNESTVTLRGDEQMKFYLLQLR